MKKILLIAMLSITGSLASGAGDTVIPLSMAGRATTANNSLVRASVSFDDIGDSDLGSDARFTCNIRNAEKLSASGTLKIDTNRIRISGLCFNSRSNKVDIVGDLSGRDIHVTADISKNGTTTTLRGDGNLEIRGIRYTVELNN